MTSVALVPVARGRHWRAAQWIGVALTLVLLAGLVAAPKPTLHILWDMVIPLLPAAFLLNPLLWRNVCPLATLNSLPGERVPPRHPDSATVSRAWIVGILLLALLVPARRFLFNQNGLALAFTIVLVALLALGTGFAFSRRSGFCNAICPVLPVEKLYGQSPLFDVGTARCGTCTVCTPIGCIELARAKTIAQTLGPARRANGWLGSPFGAFAAAFPGFIIGYFTTQNGSPGTAVSVYLHVGLYAGASYLLVSLLAWMLRLPSTIELLLLGASSIALYYWLAAPTLAAAYDAPDVGPVVVRIAALALIAIWVSRGLTRARAHVAAT
jgi:nitrite reductase (NADH) large subunit